QHLAGALGLALALAGGTVQSRRVAAATADELRALAAPTQLRADARHRLMQPRADQHQRQSGLLMLTQLGLHLWLEMFHPRRRQHVEQSVNLRCALACHRAGDATDLE